MIRGMYSAASALVASVRNQELVAENLAHASTPGFRRTGMAFETLQLDPGAARPMAGTQATRTYTSFDSGPMQRTGNPLDVALSGEVFFVLDGPRGPVYTRNGSFELSAQGELRSAGGLPVRGGGGPITIPAGASRIDIGQDGTVRADNIEVGRLQIAYLPDPRVLQRVGSTLFEGPSPQSPPEGVAYRVEQGFREGANVNVVNEMVSMMMGLRQYEAAERALKSLGEAVEQNTRPVS